MSLKHKQEEVKNLKISTKHHEMLKKYCRKNGLKMFKFVERLIEEKCKTPKDIYGDD